MASGTRPVTLDDILNTRTLPPQRAVALAPVGDLVAVARRREGDGAVQDSPVPRNWANCRLSVHDPDGRFLVALAPHTYAAWGPVWSPDGMRLAFLAADTSAASPGLWMWERGTPGARRLDTPPAVPHEALHWFPDGRRLCVGFMRPAREPEAALGPSVFRSPVRQGTAPAAWFDGWLGAVPVDGGEIAPLVVGVSAFAGMPAPLDHPERAGQSVAWCETGQGGMGAPPWERPERYVVNSPVFALDRIHTPLLLLAGDRDPGVPWSQSGEVYVGLNRLGRTCELAVYRGEGHTVRGWQETNRRDAVTRILRWLDTHLGR